MSCRLLLRARLDDVEFWLSDEIAPDQYNYGHLQVFFDDGSIGWYEAAWGPSVSEAAFMVKDIVGPKGSVSVVPPSRKPGYGKGATWTFSSDIHTHGAMEAVLVHHAALNGEQGLVEGDELIPVVDKPDHDEVAGALALMLLTQARTAARTNGQGDLVPLSEQDRTLWDRQLIAEGVAILERVLPRGHIGPFQLQAAVAAVHAEAPGWENTDWLEISLLYAMLERLAPSPAVTLNRAVAVGMTTGPGEGLAVLEPLLADPAMQRHHRTHAVRAHLLEMAGDVTGAAESYERAARLTSSLPEQRYLNRRLQRVSNAPRDEP